MKKLYKTRKNIIGIFFEVEDLFVLCVFVYENDNFYSA